MSDSNVPVDEVAHGDEPGAAPAGGKAERSARVPFAVLIVALLGGGLCALLALNTVTAASEVRQRNVDAANASLTDSQQQLSRDISALQAPAELARRAAALGLVPADSPAFLRLNADGSVTLLGAPAPATIQPPATTPAPTTPATTSATTTSAKSTAAKASAKSTVTPSGTRAKATTSAPKPKPKPKPTSTPTVTVTLPGGPR